MRADIAAAIEEIAQDRQAGASEIVRRAAQIFSLLDESDDLLDVCRALIGAQPAMASLANLASAVAQSRRAEEAARRFIEKTERAIRDASLHAAGLIKDNSTVLTHSRSSTVVRAFRAALRDGRAFRVIATESRPLLEGRRLASELADCGSAVTLIADAAAALFMDQIDFVLVGADTITPHHLVNKTGTRMIALAAAERSVPVYGLADAAKFIDFSADEAARDPNELWADAPAGVGIINRYFEPVPIGLFTRIITEEGALEIAEVRRRAASSSLHPLLAYSDSLKPTD
jgi:translation initiation factor eIF-2B subunit delta